VADAASSEDASVPAAVAPDASPARVKPAGSKAEDKAGAGGPKAERTADGSKSPKKSKKKSGKGKSGKSHADGTAGSVAAQPSVATKQDVAAQNDADEPADGRRGPAGRILADNFLAVILGVVAIGLAVAFVLTMLQLRNDNALDSARTSALASAKTYSVELAGYDYRHLNQDFAVVLSHSTPSFRTSFSKSSNALKSTLLKYHASAKATVVAGGVISATSTRVVALVFLDQTVTNSTQKQPTTDRSQVEITLVRTGGTWLIDQVTLL
jgi:Mce-associated membrane protein